MSYAIETVASKNPIFWCSDENVNEERERIVYGYSVEEWSDTTNKAYSNYSLRFKWQNEQVSEPQSFNFGGQFLTSIFDYNIKLFSTLNKYLLDKHIKKSYEELIDTEWSDYHKQQLVEVYGYKDYPSDADLKYLKSNLIEDGTAISGYSLKCCNTTLHPDLRHLPTKYYAIEVSDINYFEQLVKDNPNQLGLKRNSKKFKVAGQYTTLYASEYFKRVKVELDNCYKVYVSFSF